MSAPPSPLQRLLQQSLQLHQSGKLAQAAAGYAQLRAAQPQNFEAHHLGGAAALQLGKFDEAIALLNRATQLRPNSGSTFMILGLAFANLGRRDEAEKALRNAVRLEPKNHEAWGNLGSGLLAARKIPEAIAAFQKCVEVNPRYANGWSGLGGALQNAGRLSEAIEAQTRALALDPRHPHARSLRAQAFQNLHEVEKSLADFDAHLAANPDDLEAASFRLFLLNYDAGLSAQKIFEEHAAYGQRVARLRRGVRPAVPAATAGGSAKNLGAQSGSSRKLKIAFLSPDLREHSVARFVEPLLRHLDRERFHVTLYHDHFLEDAGSARLAKLADIWRNFFGQAASVVEQVIRQDQIDVLIDLAGHTGFNRLSSFEPRLAPTQITYLGYPNTTGLPSMDFRFTDAVADPIEDTSQPGADQSDATQRSASQRDADERDASQRSAGLPAGQPEKSPAARDAILGSRPEAGAPLVAAPLRGTPQAPSTTIPSSVPSITPLSSVPPTTAPSSAPSDSLPSSKSTTPPDALHTEKLVRFAPTAWSFQPPANSPPIAAGGPSARGEPFTFGSFNSLSKINAFTLKMWADLLAATPGSRLLLKGFQANPAAVRERVLRAGIDESRLLLSPHVADINEHLATFAQVDVALDPFPYNGTTTTCETLWMGVPIVTLAGDRHASRVGASLLTAVGHPEWIAYSPEDYIRIAKAFADAPQNLVPLRPQLRAAMEASPLLDHLGQAKRFADAILACAQR